MTANEFQRQTIETAIYPDVNTGSVNELMYLSSGLIGETGEIANNIAKYYRDGKFDVEHTRKEIGDVLWYLARLCCATGTTLEDEMERNAEKLKSRLLRGKIGGSGDDR